MNIGLVCPTTKLEHEIKRKRIHMGHKNDKIFATAPADADTPPFRTIPGRFVYRQGRKDIGTSRNRQGNMS